MGNPTSHLYFFGGITAHKPLSELLLTCVPVPFWLVWKELNETKAVQNVIITKQQTRWYSEIYTAFATFESNLNASKRHRNTGILFFTIDKVFGPSVEGTHNQWNTRAAHNGKVGHNTIEYTFMYSNWLYFLWHDMSVNDLEAEHRRYGLQKMVVEHKLGKRLFQFSTPFANVFFQITGIYKGVHPDFVSTRLTGIRWGNIYLLFIGQLSKQPLPRRLCAVWTRMEQLEKTEFPTGARLSPALAGCSNHRTREIPTCYNGKFCWEFSLPLRARCLAMIFFFFCACLEWLRWFILKTALQLNCLPINLSGVMCTLSSWRVK